MSETLLHGCAYPFSRSSFAQGSRENDASSLTRHDELRYRDDSGIVIVGSAAVAGERE